MNGIVRKSVFILLTFVKACIILYVIVGSVLYLPKAPPRCSVWGLYFIFTDGKKNHGNNHIRPEDNGRQVLRLEEGCLHRSIAKV